MKLSTIGTIIFLAGAVSFSTSPAWGDETAELEVLKKEVESLKAGQRAIREEIKSLKTLLSAQQQRSNPVRDVNVTMNVAEDPFKGMNDAQVTMIEFSDYQCPFCSRHTRAVLPQLEKNYIETGKIKYVLRDFPLSFHKQAPKAHEAAHCAEEQGKYWEMHAQLFANQKALHLDKLPKYAETAGVPDLTAFQKCLDSGKYEKRISSSMAEGSKLGIRGTPTFAIGMTESNGTVKALKIIRGAQAYPVFQKVIDNLLASGKAENNAAPKTGGG
jgi:protein-disulfide isomerase